jgi:hypothetical protein
MELRALLGADIYRDGGSFRAVFETDEGQEYGLWLQRSAFPDASGLHHRWLFEFSGRNKPDGAIPIVTGSDDEKRIVAMLERFLAEAQANTERSDQEGRANGQLVRMLEHIRRRDPCFPSDLRAAGFVR